jgi:hypothetical protein
VVLGPQGSETLDVSRQELRFPTQCTTGDIESARRSCNSTKSMASPSSRGLAQSAPWNPPDSAVCARRIAVADLRVTAFADSGTLPLPTEEVDLTKGHLVEGQKRAAAALMWMNGCGPLSSSGTRFAKPTTRPTRPRSP